MAELPLARLRTICLALPEAVEDHEGVGRPSFKVRGRIFAMLSSGRHADGRAGLWCKAAAGAQADLVAGDPVRFFVPPYVGRHGWVGVRLVPEPDWDRVADLIEESYTLIAPRRLAAMVRPEVGGPAGAP